MYIVCRQPLGVRESCSPSPHVRAHIFIFNKWFKKSNLWTSPPNVMLHLLRMCYVLSANRWERVFRGICNFLCHLPLSVYRFYISFVYQISWCVLSPGFRICVPVLINCPILEGEDLHSSHLMQKGSAHIRALQRDCCGRSRPCGGSEFTHRALCLPRTF